MFGLFKNSSRKRCCAGFQGNYECAGQRGFAVLVHNDDYPGAQFLIQSRAVAQEDQSRHKIESKDVPVALVTQTGMGFCPWSGTNLKRAITYLTHQCSVFGFGAIRTPLNMGIKI